MKVSELLEQDEWMNVPIKFDEMVPVLQKKIKALLHQKEMLRSKSSNAKDGLHSFHYNMMSRDLDMKITRLQKQIGTIERTAALQ